MYFLKLCYLKMESVLFYFVSVQTYFNPEGTSNIFGNR